MKNKLLVTIKIPSYEMEYEVYIPNNKKVGTLKKKILFLLNELLQIDLNKTENDIQFIDKETGIELQNNMCIKDSRIKNGSTILII